MAGPADLPGPTRAQLEGHELYGEEFSLGQVALWFAEDASGYSRQSGPALEPRNYGYREQNRQTLLRHVPANRRLRHVLGFGSGYGTELVPLADRIEQLTIVEAGHGYGVDPALSMPVEVLQAQATGDIALDDAAVELVTCFGVLMYVPNVSHVLREFARVLVPGGFVLLREPITSLGLGEGKRGSGLTTHARGVPLDYLHRRLTTSGFVVEHETLTSFVGITKLWGHGIAPYNSRFLTGLDVLLCQAMARRVRYRASDWWEKLRPGGVSIVARRL